MPAISGTASSVAIAAATITAGTIRRSMNDEPLTGRDQKSMDALTFAKRD